MKKNIFTIVISFVLIGLYLTILCNRLLVRGEDEMSWKDFGIWFEWKSKQDLTSTQKKVITYLKEVNSVYDECSGLWSDKYKANCIQLVEECLYVVNRKTAPEICKKYKQMILNHMNAIKTYCILKSKNYDDNSEEIIAINSKILELESKPFAEFFRILKEINLFDNYDKEVLNIKKRIKGRPPK